MRCKSRGNKSSIQCHKNKCALYRVAENLFKSSPWRNPTKVKISCLYSLPYPVSPHTNASFLCCMKSQNLRTGLTKMVPDVFPILFICGLSHRM